MLHQRVKLLHSWQKKFLLKFHCRRLLALPSYLRFLGTVELNLAVTGVSVLKFVSLLTKVIK